MPFQESGGGGGAFMEYTCVRRCPPTPEVLFRNRRQIPDCFSPCSALSHWHRATCNFKTNIPVSVPRMSVGLLANQGSLSKRGGGVSEPMFWHVDDDLLGPNEDLWFSKENTAVHSPKSSSALSNSALAFELSVVYCKNTTRGFISTQILRHPPCNCSSGYQGSSNTANIYIALLAMCSILGVWKFIKGFSFEHKEHTLHNSGCRGLFWTFGHSETGLTLLLVLFMPDLLKTVMLSHVIRRPAGNHLLKALLWFPITKKTTLAGVAKYWFWLVYRSACLTFTHAHIGRQTVTHVHPPRGCCWATWAMSSLLN